MTTTLQQWGAAALRVGDYALLVGGDGSERARGALARRLSIGAAGTIEVPPDACRSFPEGGRVPLVIERRVDGGSHPNPFAFRTQRDFAATVERMVRGGTLPGQTKVALWNGVQLPRSYAHRRRMCPAALELNMREHVEPMASMVPLLTTRRCRSEAGLCIVATAKLFCGDGWYPPEADDEWKLTRGADVLVIAADTSREELRVLLWESVLSGNALGDATALSAELKRLGDGRMLVVDGRDAVTPSLSFVDA
jgi:hypothetical protein